MGTGLWATDTMRERGRDEQSMPSSMGAMQHGAASTWEAVDTGGGAS